MKSYQNLNNHYIKPDSYLERTRNQEADISLGSSVYNRKERFFIPKEYDGLAQMSLKVTMTTDADNSNRTQLWQTKIYKRIQLRTKRGTVLQEIFPSYTHYRITSADSNLYTQVSDAINPVPPFNTTTSVFYLPLFFWFSENPKYALRTRYLEELELYVETNDSAAAMGLTGNVTFINTELRMKFIEPRDAIPFTGSTIEVYNVFQEEVQQISSGSTSHKMLLKNPYPSYLTAIHVESQSATKAQYEVSNVKLETRGDLWLDIDRKEEFKLYNRKFVTTSDGSQFIHLFSKDLDRREPPYTKDLMLFTGEMYPTYLTCEFNASSDSFLYVTYEHINRFEISDDGSISETIRTGTFQYNKN